MSAAGRRASEWLPALIFGVGVLVVWQASIAIFDIQQFLLPRPTDIVSALWEKRADLLSSGWYTFTEAFWGWVLGCSAAFGLALLLARFRPLGAALMPYAVGASAIPIIAFAPIANAWFGIEKGSKIFIAAVLSFFPVLVNSLRGLTSVRPQSIELMRSYAAGQLTVFRRVRIPTALPFVFTALKTATVLSMIGAIVGEYFGGSQEQLGIVITNAAALFDFKTAWAAILVACLLGIGFYLAVAAIEAAVMRRYPAAGGRRT